MKTYGQEDRQKGLINRGAPAKSLKGESGERGLPEKQKKKRPAKPSRKSEPTEKRGGD